MSYPKIEPLNLKVFTLLVNGEKLRQQGGTKPECTTSWRPEGYTDGQLSASLSSLAKMTLVFAFHAMKESYQVMRPKQIGVCLSRNISNRLASANQVERNLNRGKPP